MNRADVVARIRGLEPRLRTYGVASLSLYGSYARDEPSSDSDIDIIADFEQDVRLGLSRLMDTVRELEEAFPGIEVGLSTRDGLVPLYRPYIESAALRIF